MSHEEQLQDLKNKVVLKHLQKRYPDVGFTIENVQATSSKLSNMEATYQNLVEKGRRIRTSKQTLISRMWHSITRLFGG